MARAFYSSSVPPLFEAGYHRTSRTGAKQQQQATHRSGILGGNSGVGPHPRIIEAELPGNHVMELCPLYAPFQQSCWPQLGRGRGTLRPPEDTQDGRLPFLHSAWRLMPHFSWEVFRLSVGCELGLTHSGRLHFYVSSFLSDLAGEARKERA